MWFGVVQDYQQARLWYQKAGALGDTYAMYNLGLIYAQGHGVPQNLELARQWYHTATAAGNEDAKQRLRELDC